MSEHGLFMFCFNLSQRVPEWCSGKTTGLRIGQYKVVEGRGFESRRQLFFFFFFFFQYSYFR